MRLPRADLKVCASRDLRSDHVWHGSPQPPTIYEKGQSVERGLQVLDAAHACCALFWQSAPSLGRNQVAAFRLPGRRHVQCQGRAFFVPNPAKYPLIIVSECVIQARSVEVTGRTTSTVSRRTVEVPPAASWLITRRKSPTVYRRIRRANSKFWPSDGALGNYFLLDDNCPGIRVCSWDSTEGLRLPLSPPTKN